MANYNVVDWATAPFSSTWTSIARGNYADPQRASQGADDLFCYDQRAALGGIFATVKQGVLDNGTQSHNGPLQIGSIRTFASTRCGQVISGPFGNSGAQVLLYDPCTGTGTFFRIDTSGILHVVKQNTGWRSSWTEILAGKFSNDPGFQLLFYDKAAGTGEFYSVDQTGGLHLIRTLNGWRQSWYTIVTGNFSSSPFDDLLFYDKSAGTGEFWKTDGHGNISLFHQHTDWRGSWHGVKSGGFELNAQYSGLLFYEDSTGFTELYGTDGSGGIRHLNVTFDYVWQTQSPHFDNVLVGNFIGAGVLSDIVAYNPSGASVSYFRLVPHA